MPQVIEPLAHQFAAGVRSLDRLVADFEPADWWRTTAGGHHACWLVGHLAVQRRLLVTIVGLTLTGLSIEWEQSFRRGSRPADVPRHIDPQALLATLHALEHQMGQHWPNLTAGDLTAPVERPFPDGSRTLGGAIRYLGWHEAYHLGQLGMLRRLLGKPPVLG